MRKIIALIILSLPLLVYSQDSGLDGGLRLFVDVGVHGFGTEKGTIFLDYTDESPSRDHLTSNTDLNGNPFSGSLRLGGEWEMKQGVFFKTLLDGYFGKVRGMSFDFGAGYSFGKKIKIRPNLMFGWGGSKIRLGDIYQNDIFIEVNDTRFYSERVTVKLANKYFVIRPGIDFALPMKEFFEFRMGVGYNIPLVKTSPHLRFIGNDESEKPIDAKESIFAPNVYIRHDNETISKSVVKYALPSITIGIGWKIGKQFNNQ